MLEFQNFVRGLLWEKNLGKVIDYMLLKEEKEFDIFLNMFSILSWSYLHKSTILETYFTFDNVFRPGRLPPFPKVTQVTFCWAAFTVTRHCLLNLLHYRQPFWNKYAWKSTPHIHTEYFNRCLSWSPKVKQIVGLTMIRKIWVSNLILIGHQHGFFCDQANFFSLKCYW